MFVSYRTWPDLLRVFIELREWNIKSQAHCMYVCVCDGVGEG